MSKELWFNMVTNNRYQQAYQSSNYSRGGNQSTGNQTYNQSANTNTRGTTTNAGLSDNRGNTSTNNNQLMVSCNACQNGYPVGITMAPPGQCPAGSTENKMPCGPLIDCAKCDNGYAIMSATRPYQQAGCSSLGAGWVNANDAMGRYIDPCITKNDGINNTNTPSGYLDCYDCNNQIMNRIDNTQSCQTSYPGSLTSVVSSDTGTSPNPCPPPPPSPDILCHTCSTGFPQSNLFQGQSCPEGWTTDMNPCGTSTGGGIAGCTNPSAYNYNSSATIDDGSCALPITPNPNLWPGQTPGPTCAEYPDMMGCPPVVPQPPVPPAVIDVDVEPQTAGLKDNKLLMFGLIGVVAYMLLKGKGITTTK